VGVYDRLTPYYPWIESIQNLTSPIQNKLTSKRERIRSMATVYQCDTFKVECGCSSENVASNSAWIASTEEAVPYSWTMSVSIRLNDTDVHACTGSILSTSYILTSASCIDGALPHDISIAAGIHNRIEDFAFIRYVRDVYIHPDWNSSDTSFRNDIALLKIFPPLSIASGGMLARICIPNEVCSNQLVNSPPNASELIIVGWRTNRHGNTHIFDEMQQTRVHTIDNELTCKTAIRDKQKQFCGEATQKGKTYL
jgi:secreted trypsin-like serine protease